MLNVTMQFILQEECLIDVNLFNILADEDCWHKKFQSLMWMQGCSSGHKNVLSEKGDMWNLNELSKQNHIFLKTKQTKFI